MLAASSLWKQENVKITDTPSQPGLMKGHSAASVCALSTTNLVSANFVIYSTVLYVSIIEKELWPSKQQSI